MFISLFFKYLFILKVAIEKDWGERGGERDLSPTRSLLKRPQQPGHGQAEIWDQEILPASYESSGPEDLAHSSVPFLDVLAKSYIGSGAPGT